MKLRAPEGVGDACVAGVPIAACNGLYEVDPETGALLIECFGFVAVAPDAAKASRPPIAARRGRRPAGSAAAKSPASKKS